jgi:MFS family permease
MNRTIKLLMFSDIFVLTGFGLINPIIAIFIKENLVDGTIFAAGLATTIFFVTKSVIQLPFSRYVDTHREKVRWLIIGTFIISLVPFIYIFSETVQMIYLAELLYGLGAGFAYPTWLGLWSTHLDEHHESFEWSLYSTAVGTGTALTASFGAAIANLFGFVTTFSIVGFMSLMGCLVLFGLEKRKETLPKPKNHHYHKKRKVLEGKHHKHN